MGACVRLAVIAAVLTGVVGCTDGADDTSESSVPNAPTTTEAQVPPEPLEVDDLAGAWVDADGAPAPRGDSTWVEVLPGPEHCGWQHGHFLWFAVMADTEAVRIDELQVYLRDPDRALLGPPWEGLPDVDLDAELPASAEFTGFSTGDVELWIDEGQPFAFLTDGETVERWPQVDPPPLCA